MNAIIFTDTYLTHADYSGFDPHVSGASCYALRSLAGAAAFLAMAGGAVGCGQDDAARQRAEAAQRARTQKIAQARAEREKRAREAAKARTCLSTFRQLTRELGDLNSRLDVGLNYDEYTTKVGDVKVAYDQTPFKQLDDIACLQQVGLPAESALNQYAKAAGIWDRCFDDPNCSNDQIKGQLQSHWSTASRQVRRASRGMARMTAIAARAPG
jgi:hypothetical protein